jgi:hypothetical protein
VIGGTSLQKKLTACIEQVSAKDLGRLPGFDHSMTVVIIEHQRFLQVRNSFGVHWTKLAFSNLGIRRIYLSSDVFRDLDTVWRCIPHELGHFVMRTVYEGQAEIAAERIRKRAREVCTMRSAAAPAQSRVLSSRLKEPGGRGRVGPFPGEMDGWPRFASAFCELTWVQEDSLPAADGLSFPIAPRRQMTASDGEWHRPASPARA